MNKAELVSNVAQGAEITKATAETTVNAVVNGIKESLQKGESVTLVGFASFSVKEKKARKGRHPRTGKEINIPASKTVKFKVGKEMKEMLNK